MKLKVFIHIGGKNKSKNFTSFVLSCPTKHSTHTHTHSIDVFGCPYLDIPNLLFFFSHFFFARTANHENHHHRILIRNTVILVIFFLALFFSLFCLSNIMDTKLENEKKHSNSIKSIRIEYRIYIKISISIVHMVRMFELIFFSLFVSSFYILGDCNFVSNLAKESREKIV